MNYLIAVLVDRKQAEQAYTALEKIGLVPQHVSIIGKGYKRPEELGLIDFREQAKKQALWMAAWLIPFGFVGGYLFNLITGLETFDWAGNPGNHILGGLAGAIGGAMGSVFVGGGIGLSSGSGDGFPYGSQLKEGKYLLVVQGSEAIKRQATQILRGFNPESLQNYTVSLE